MMKLYGCALLPKHKDILLWHYTSAEVFWKMLGGEFYATHYRFLNDSTEITYGVYEIEQFLHNDTSLKGLQFAVDDLKRKDIFLLCFSKDPDNLYQWRSYTPNGGFSIGFSYNKLVQLLNESSFDPEKLLLFNLVGCQYLPQNSIAEFMYKLTSEFKTSVSQLSNIEKSLFKKSLLRIEKGDFSKEIGDLHQKSPKLFSLLVDMYKLSFLLQAECPAFKNPSFKFEKEYRLVVTGENLRKRINLIGGKPRIKIPIENIQQCIKQLYISPHGDVEQNKLLAEIAKERFGLDFQIHTSKSSYNGK